MPEGVQRDFREIYYWYDNYAKSGVPDQRAVDDYIECETDEKVRAFRAQVYAISQGSYNESILVQKLGLSRKQRHGSFEDWAKLLLNFLAKHRKS